jgi:nucleoside-diphosphate-sugar epimerase
VSLNRALEMLAGLAGRPLDVRREGPQHGDVVHTGADCARAGAELGFEAATELAAGLEAELEWVLARPGARARAAAGR